MKKKILIGILVLALVFTLGKNKIIEIFVERSCTSILGAKLDIRSMRIGILRTAIDIRGMKLYNPEGYPDELMADIPGIYVDYSLPRLLKGTVHLKELKFYLKEFNIIKNSNGEVNVNSLKPVRTKTNGKKMEQQEKDKTPDIEIDILYLKADDVFYKDYTKDPVEVQDFKVGINERYENISDPYTLVRLIIARVIRNTAASGLINVPMAEVQKVMGSVYQVGASAVEGTTGTAGKLVKEAGGTVKALREGLGEAIAGPFSREGSGKQ